MTSAVVAAALLFGLAGTASVANAATPTAVTGATVTETTPGPGDDEMTTQGTRQFTITNFSAHSLTINDIWGTSGWPYPKKTGFDPYDEFPLAGSVLKPGQQMTFEIRDWSNHGITVNPGRGRPRTRSSTCMSRASVATRMRRGWKVSS